MADTTVSLEVWLRQANEQGLKILFSSALIPGFYKVTYDESAAIELSQVRQVLGSYGLALRESGDNVWSVVRTEVPAEPPAIAGIPLEQETLDQRLPLEELVVSSSRFRLMMQKTVSRSGFDNKQLTQRPALGNDGIQVVNQLPGSSGVGLSARPRVRGGAEDETLIEFDGMRLYEPYHFRHFNSLFSTFDARIIDSIDFYTGGFPVQRGDRLSGAMVIDSRAPEDIRDIRELGVGLYNLSWLQSRNTDDYDWMFSGRRSTLQYLAHLSDNDLGEPRYGDFFGRFGLNLDDGDRLTFNFFWFEDDISVRTPSGNEQAASDYNNAYSWLRYEGELVDGLYVRTLAGFAVIGNERTGQVDKQDIVKGMLEDQREFRVANLKQDFEFQPEADWMLMAGWEIRYLEADYELYSEIALDPAFATIANYPRPATLTTDYTETGYQYAAYVDIKKSLTDRLTTEIGLRVDGQHYETSVNDHQFNPRINFHYQLTDSTELRLGWGAFSQAEGIHELKIADGARTFQPAQKAYHLIAGVDHQFANDFTVRLEFFDKHGNEINPYFQNLTNPLTLIPELQADRFLVKPARYEAEGVELSVAGTVMNIDVWGNYSYSSIKDKVNGDKVRRSWDQTHGANVGLATELFGWKLAVSNAWHKGWFTTPLNLQAGVLSVGPRNSTRFSEYSSWDLKVVKSWQLGNQTLRLEAGVTNLLDRQNQIGADYEVEDDELELDGVFGMPQLPFIDLYWQF
ncbi:MAG: TonB-dependent receptor [Pseudomonadales bacterium]|nr:TonB-dependent receptor [Pseudomonadales bacterium]